MEKMTPAQRAEFAERVQDERVLAFGDNKKAAYSAAQVNPGTWDRVEQGLTVRGPTIYAVCKTLWPASGGDWRKLVPPLEGTGLLDAKQEERVRKALAEADLDEETREKAFRQLERGAS